MAIGLYSMTDGHGLSDYKWGWAAFHYGRWFRDDRRGWLWKPGNEWGAAWLNGASQTKITDGRHWV